MITESPANDRGLKIAYSLIVTRRHTGFAVPGKAGSRKQVQQKTVNKGTGRALAFKRPMEMKANFQNGNL